MTTTPGDLLSIPLSGITVHRPAKRGDDHELTMGRIAGRGTTLAAAKADLARQIIATCESVAVDPAYARDDDGSLIVALARPWGVDEYRITSEGHRLISTYAPGCADPVALLARTHHYTPVPARG